MRRTPHQKSAGQLDPALRHSLGYVVVASVLLTLGVAAVTLAVLYPVAALGAVALSGAGWYAVRAFRRFYRTRRRAGWTRHVCVPGTGICVEL